MCDLENEGSVIEQFLNRRDFSKETYPYYYPRYDLTGEFNFNFVNGLLGSVVLELTAEQTNAHYLRLTCGNDVYYYFITSITQVNADTYNLTLELDVLMTYQDEFLTGMKDVPVFTTRKHDHRYTADGLMPYCCDLKTGEDAFSNVKPNIIKGFKQLHYKNDEMKKLEGVMWLYVCVDLIDIIDSDSLYKLAYTCNGKSYPLYMIAIPINVSSITYQKSDGTKSLTFTRTQIDRCIRRLVGDGTVHGAKISPYAPFSILGGATIEKSLRSYTIKCDTLWHSNESSSGNTYGYNIDGCKILVSNVSGIPERIGDLVKNGAVIVAEQNYPFYPLEDLVASDLGVANTSKPSCISARYEDPKTLFAPFKKYVLSSQYTSNGYEFYPELLFCEYTTNTSELLISFNSYSTAFIGDNNFYTEITSPVRFDTFKNYLYQRLGLAGSVNYQMPCGTDALDVFNSTQRQSFYNSKIASGITSGLTIAGGIASIGLGIAGIGGTLGMGTPASIGMIAGGATAITGGVASLATNIASIDAKMEDLKNTPDTINISGADFITDDNIINNGGLPYIIRYECVEVIKENANEFFYNFGYQTARNCYFNTELKVDLTQDKFIDNNLFTRSIFNYIQINEDITNKINANIPLIIKQKLSSIFNNGITLWSFFKFSQLWKPIETDVPSSTYYLDRWLFKDTLDNSEVDTNWYQ